MAWTWLILGALSACAGSDKGDPIDLDGDGFDERADCDDESAAVHPGAEERCNGIDDDCDEQADEPGASGGYEGFLDADGDGFGAGDPVAVCVGTAGTTLYPGDCDDADAAVSPLADEACDEVDNDCDGLTDEAGAIDGATWPIDRDGDGYGHPVLTGTACASGDGFADNATDCDDGDPTRNPGAGEVCTNGQDDDCDGSIDETDDPDPPSWYVDEDGDGFGTSVETLEQCAPELGYASNDGDCNDQDAAVHPGAPDGTDEIDNDCDGEIDEPGDSVGEGEMTYHESVRRSSCSLVWKTTWEELYPAPVGDYAWRVTHTYDRDESDSAEDCDFALRSRDFVWDLGFYWDSLGGEAQTVWVREEGTALWLPMFAAELRRSAGELLYETSIATEDEDTEAELSGEVDFLGF